MIRIMIYKPEPPAHSAGGKQAFRRFAEFSGGLGKEVSGGLQRFAEVSGRLGTEVSGGFGRFADGGGWHGGPVFGAAKSFSNP